MTSCGQPPTLEGIAPWLLKRVHAQNESITPFLQEVAWNFSSISWFTVVSFVVYFMWFYENLTTVIILLGNFEHSAYLGLDQLAWARQPKVQPHNSASFNWSCGQLKQPTNPSFAATTDRPIKRCRRICTRHEKWFIHQKWAKNKFFRPVLIED